MKILIPRNLWRFQHLKYLVYCRSIMESWYHHKTCINIFTCSIFIKLGKFVTFYDDYDFLAGLEQFYLLEVFLAEIDLFSSCFLMINATGKHKFLVLPQTANVLNCLLSTFRIQNRCNSVWCMFGTPLWWDWAHVP